MSLMVTYTLGTGQARTPDPRPERETMKNSGILLAAIAALMITGGTPAIANATDAQQPEVPAAPQEFRPSAGEWVCTVYASDPRKNGDFIEGDGSQSCVGAGFGPTELEVVIQRYRGMWLWETVKSMRTEGAPYLTQPIAFDCRGQGSQLYRIVATGKAEGGRYSQSVRSEEEKRFVCGG